MAAGNSPGDHLARFCGSRFTLRFGKGQQVVVRDQVIANADQRAVVAAGEFEIIPGFHEGR